MVQSAALRCGRRVFKSIGVIAIASAVLAGCSGDTALERLTEARRLSADLFIQFTRASNAANQAVMADTDEASIAFAEQAEETKKQVQADIDALRPVLRDLNYADEMRLLEEFVTGVHGVSATWTTAFSNSRSRTRTSRRSVCRSANLSRPPTPSRKRSTRSCQPFLPPTRGESGRSSPVRSRICAPFRSRRRRTSPNPTTQ